MSSTTPPPQGCDDASFLQSNFDPDILNHSNNMDTSNDDELRTISTQKETPTTGIKEAHQEVKLTKKSTLQHDLEKSQEEVRILKDEIQVLKMRSIAGPCERARDATTRMADSDRFNKSLDKLQDTYNISTLKHLKEMATFQEKFEAALDNLVVHRRKSKALQYKFESFRTNLVARGQELTALQNNLESDQEQLAEFRLKKQIGVGLNQIVSGVGLEEKERELAESKKLLDIAQKQNDSEIFELDQRKRDMIVGKEELEEKENEFLESIEKNDDIKGVRGMMTTGLVHKLMEANEELAAKDKEINDLREKITALENVQQTQP